MGVFSANYEEKLRLKRRRQEQKIDTKSWWYLSAGTIRERLRLNSPRHEQARYRMGRNWRDVSAANNNDKAMKRRRYEQALFGPNGI